MLAFFFVYISPRQCNAIRVDVFFFSHLPLVWYVVDGAEFMEQHVWGCSFTCVAGCKERGIKSRSEGVVRRERESEWKLEQEWRSGQTCNWRGGIHVKTNISHPLSDHCTFSLSDLVFESCIACQQSVVPMYGHLRVLRCFWNGCSIIAKFMIILHDYCRLHSLNLK